MREFIWADRGLQVSDDFPVPETNRRLLERFFDHMRSLDLRSEDVRILIARLSFLEPQQFRIWVTVDNEYFDEIVGPIGQLVERLKTAYSGEYSAIYFGTWHLLAYNLIHYNRSWDPSEQNFDRSEHLGLFKCLGFDPAQEFASIEAQIKAEQSRSAGRKKKD